jgi:hypothetical protein
MLDERPGPKELRPHADRVALVDEEEHLGPQRTEKIDGLNGRESCRRGDDSR